MSSTDGQLPAQLHFGAVLVVGHVYASTMPVPRQYCKYFCGTSIAEPQSCDQVSANNRLRSNASTEPVQISVPAWYRCPVPRQYRWTTSSQDTFRSRAGGRPCLCQHYASTAPVLQILLRYWSGTKPLVNFHLG